MTNSNKLKREIILHIFNRLNLFVDSGSGQLKTGFMESFLTDKFKLDKKIVFELDDKTKHEQNIWAAISTVEKAVIKIIIADLAENEPEFGIIVQMNDAAPFGMQISLDNDDFGSILINYAENTWIDGGVQTHAKFLLGVESLAETICEWKRLDNYEDLYKKLLTFLNAVEGNV